MQRDLPGKNRPLSFSRSCLQMFCLIYVSENCNLNVNKKLRYREEHSASVIVIVNAWHRCTQWCEVRVATKQYQWSTRYLVGCVQCVKCSVICDAVTWVAVLFITVLCFQFVLSEIASWAYHTKDSHKCRKNLSCENWSFLLVCHHRCICHCLYCLLLPMLFHHMLHSCQKEKSSAW